jgi:hypothetical protein
MKNNRINQLFIFALFSLLGFNSCKEKEIEPGEENELITTVNLKLTNAGNSQTFKYLDLDGDGGKAATIDKIILKPNTEYSIEIELFDESKSPKLNIGEEVAEEADEHLFVFTANPASLLKYTYTDKDKNNLPIGLKGTITTTTATSGTLKVQLRHQPPVNGKATKDGTANPGSDDININFDLAVQ